MEIVERDVLSRLTPCQPSNQQAIAQALAIVHAKLVIFIHPFREGNGRCARLLALLMALQSRVTAVGLQGVGRAGQEKLHLGDSRGYGPKLQTDDRVV